MRKLANAKAVFWFAAGAIVAGCAPIGMGSGYEDPPKPMIYAFDIVKRIEPGVTAEADPNEFKQDVYGLGPQARLLMRFKDLLPHVSDVRIDGDNKVQVQLTVVGDAADAAAAADAISVCALTRHFMMFATWDAAHQFGTTGRWKTPGGDFDRAECAKGTVSDKDKQAVVFDVTQWFIDYPKARNANYGLIATSAKPVEIAGDTSGSAYPRLLWSE